MVVPIEKLDTYITETLKRISAGVYASSAAGIPASLPDAVQFSIQVVAPNGLNAIERSTAQTTPAKTTTVTEPIVTVDQTTPARTTDRTESAATVTSTRTVHTPLTTQSTLQSPGRTTTTTTEEATEEFNYPNTTQTTDQLNSQGGASGTTTKYTYV